MTLQITAFVWPLPSSGLWSSQRLSRYSLTKRGLGAHVLPVMTAITPRNWSVEFSNTWVFSLQIGVESSKIVLSPAWYSKLRLTTGERILALSRNEFRGLRSDFVRQLAALVTTRNINMLIFLLF
ncbi:hypothetical protein TNCV_385031 [Trichonephila clavipes]|nr:hypothetical protein TNCV_385031 [Trichonephila clavipes]